MMNPDGSEQVNLTQHPATDLEAAWSPTGEQILFVSDRGGKGVRDLYLMDPDGSNIRRVFREKIKADKRSPTWSPNGKRFAYNYRDRNRRKFGLYLAKFGQMSKASRMGVPLRGPQIVQRLPALSLTRSGLD